MNNPLFYAKILLFGEYGIIEDSQGLTLPYSFYKGTLKFSDLDNDFEKKSNQSLKKYSNYLSDLELPAEYNLDVKSFKNDIACVINVVFPTFLYPIICNIIYLIPLRKPLTL